MLSRKRHGLRGIGLILVALSGFICPATAWTRAGTEAGTASIAQQADSPPLSDNDYARFIAGMSSKPSSLAGYENRQAWVRHARFFDQTWDHYRERQLAPMRKWATRELEGVTCVVPTMFYPFSGPDFINLYALFPRARIYVLMALEPVGELPVMSAMNSRDFDAFFTDLRHTLDDLLHYHYFVSAHMKAAMGRRELKGVLPVLLFFMAREQIQILNVQYWSMKPDGTIQEASALPPASHGQNGIPGLKITFAGSSLPAGASQTLFYFRFNVFELGRNRHFTSFLKDLGPFTTFMKSASYVMFSPAAADARQLVFEESRCILQEDSGIPFKYFDPAGWEVRFFGSYKGPPPWFANRYQDDLAKAYKTAGEIGPLPFGIGYHFQVNTSNLMLGTRKEKASSR